MKRLSELVLLPVPRLVRDAAGACRLPSPGREPAGTARLVAPGIPAQGYRLRILPAGVTIEAADPAGLFYGSATLRQALAQSGGELPAGEIEDWPDFKARGVMLDVSRCRVPTMETLFALVDALAGFKINHLQLYTEHTFAYSRHRDVWAEASPFTCDEVKRLDAFCRERFVELAANQNSFGHMERWLVHPRYAGLAECTGGFEWPWGGRSEKPFSLDPTNPGSLRLLEELYDELLPCFTSRLFNVGCDETFDVGQGKNRELCARVGRGRVYLDFLLQIHERVARRGRTMMFWGDIIMEHPELVPGLPRDSVALEWGYEAEHPFADHAKRFAASGIPFWVCPGTSAWNSLAGRTANCLANLHSAAAGGLAHGAAGYLVTDWGDNGHWQQLPVSWTGLAAAAALSWCLQANGGKDPAPGLDTHIFGDSAGVTGGVLRDLGSAYARAGGRLHNTSHLFAILRRPAGAGLPDTVTEESLRETRRFVEETAARSQQARASAPDAALVREEIALTARLLLLACDKGLGLAGTARFDAEARQAAADYRRLWLARARPGGLPESASALDAALCLGA